MFGTSIANLARVFLAATDHGDSGSSVIGPRVANEVYSKIDDPNVLAIRTGNATAFEALFRTHADALIRFASTYVPTVEAAEDIVAEVFAHLWARRASWNPSRGAVAYLYGAVRNEALTVRRDTARRLTRERVASDFAEAGGNAAAVPEGQQLTLWRAINELSEPLRLVLILRWEHQLPFADIAALMGTSESSARVGLTRAMARLREMLDDRLK